MGAISIKEYARLKNVSYEAVRKQVARYKDELGEHIIIDGRQQYLDEEAVAFLDERRQKSPVVIYQASKDDELEDLRRERENLLAKIAVQADRISELAEWKSDNALLLAEAKHTQALLEAAESDVSEARQLALELDKEKKLVQEQLSSAELEAEAAKQRASEFEAQNAAMQEKLEALQKRGFWARLFNKA